MPPADGALQIISCVCVWGELKASKSQVDLNAALGTTLLQGGEEVGDVVPGVAVQTSAQALLVEVVGNQTDGTTQHEQTVEDTHAHVVLDLLVGEGTAVAEQVNEADSNTTVDVENQVVLLGGGDSLDGNGVVEQLGAREVLLDKLLDQLDTQIGVVAGLDLVANTGISLFSLRMMSTKSRGLRPLSKALVNSSAAPSRAPPKREPMVRRPETRALIRSLPARVVMMVFMAPETAGPWSAVSIRTISRNLLA